MTSVPAINLEIWMKIFTEKKNANRLKMAQNVEKTVAGFADRSATSPSEGPNLTIFNISNCKYGNLSLPQ